MFLNLRSPFIQFPIIRTLRPMKLSYFWHFFVNGKWPYLFREWINAIYLLNQRPLDTCQLCIPFKLYSALMKSQVFLFIWKGLHQLYLKVYHHFHLSSSCWVLQIRLLHSVTNQLCTLTCNSRASFQLFLSASLLSSSSYLGTSLTKW